MPSSQQRGELAEGGICRWLLLGCLGVAGSSKTGRSSLTGRELQHSAGLLVQVMNGVNEWIFVKNHRVGVA